MKSPEYGPEQFNTPESIPPTCMLVDVEAAAASGELEIGGTTTVTEGGPETYAPGRWERFCVNCGACGLSTELRRPVGKWRGAHFPDGPTEMKRVNSQCAVRKDEQDQ
jgi:hypothetical protein